MQTIINILPSYPIYFLLLSIVIFLTTFLIKSKLYSILFAISILLSNCLFKIDDYQWFQFVFLWITTIHLLAILQIPNPKQQKFFFSKYTLFLFTDCIFFLSSIIFPNAISYLALIPICVRMDIIPFPSKSNQNYMISYPLTFQIYSLQFLLAHILILKYNLNQPLMSAIVLILLFIQSFRLPYNNFNNSPPFLPLIRTVYGFSIFFLLNDYIPFSKMTFLYFILPLAFLTFSPWLKEDEFNTLHTKEINNILAKFPEILTLVAMTIIPLSFSSSILLSIFEISIFNAWNTRLAMNPIYLLCILIFCWNYHSCIFQFIKLILLRKKDNQHSNKILHRFIKPLTILAVIILTSNLMYTGNLFFFHKNPIIPLSSIKAGSYNYLLFFYLPILTVSIMSLYFRFLIDHSKTLENTYKLVNFMTSFQFLFLKNIDFFQIQNSFSRLTIENHNKLKIINKCFIHIYCQISSLSITVNKFLLKKIQLHFLLSSARTNRHIPTHLLILVFILPLIAFWSDLHTSFLSGSIIFIISGLIAILITLNQKGDIR